MGGRTGRRAFLALGSLAAMLLSGCWYNIYEVRYQNTQDLFRRLELRNQNLAPGVWSDQGGISLRIPKEWTEIPGPEQPQVDPNAPKEEQPEPSAPELDPRQPSALKLLNVNLPGIRGLFKHDKDYAYIYVLSSKNIKPPEAADQSVIEQPGMDPAKFNADICRILTDSLGTEFDPAKAVEAKFPDKPVKFVQAVTFHMIRNDYPHQLDNGSQMVWQVTLYAYAGKDPAAQVAFLTLEPQAIAGTPTAALKYSFETFSLDEASLLGSAPIGGAAAGGGL